MRTTTPGSDCPARASRRGIQRARLRAQEMVASWDRSGWPTLHLPAMAAIGAKRTCRPPQGRRLACRLKPRNQYAILWQLGDQLNYTFAMRIPTAIGRLQ